MDTFEPPKYITSLIAATINDGAKSAQTGALAFAAIGLYLLAWAIGRDGDSLRAHFARKEWRASIVSVAVTDPREAR